MIFAASCTTLSVRESATSGLGARGGLGAAALYHRGRNLPPELHGLTVCGNGNACVQCACVCVCVPCVSVCDQRGRARLALEFVVGDEPLLRGLELWARVRYRHHPAISRPSRNASAICKARQLYGTILRAMVQAAAFVEHFPGAKPLPTGCRRPSPSIMSSRTLRGKISGWTRPTGYQGGPLANRFVARLARRWCVPPPA